MPRIYARNREYAAAMEGRERLSRQRRLHSCPMTVACRWLGIDEPTLHTMAEADLVKVRRGRCGQTLYDVTPYLEIKPAGAGFNTWRSRRISSINLSNNEI